MAVDSSAVPHSIATVAGTGTAGYSGDGGAATAAQIHYPLGVAVGPDGNLYFADQYNHRIRMVNGSGTISTVAGSGVAGYSGDQGVATAARLNCPYFVAFDNAGTLHFADSENHCVRKVDSSGTISTVAGTGVAGYAGDAGAAVKAQLTRPRGIAFDSSGRLYIADSENHRIRKVDVGGVISTVAGTGTAGLGSAGPAVGVQLNSPTTVATDRLGNVFLGDWQNHRVCKVDAAGVLSVLAGTGKAGFGGDGGQATSAQLNGAYGVAVDSLGNVFVADVANQRIRMIDRLGVITSIAGVGTWGGSGEGGPATQAQLSDPYCVSLDAFGNVLVADYSGHRIHRITGPFDFDPAALIPLNSATYLANKYVATLTGKAISGAAGYEVHYDTGSWDLQLPWGCLDRSKVTTIEPGTTKDKVKGEIAVKSADGKTTYSIPDFVFWALKNADGTDMDAQQGQRFNGGLLGGFPSAGDPAMPPLVYALAKKYCSAKNLDLGFGLVSGAGKTYLALGVDSALTTDRIGWRTDKPSYQKSGSPFFPDSVPGFTVRLKFSGVDAIVAKDLTATIDTGAPEMVLRLNSNNPQDGDAVKNYVTKDGFWLGWGGGGGGAYKDAKMVVGDCVVTVSFTDSSGTTSSYSFPADKTTYKVGIGTWNGDAPWPVADDKPRTRISIGETFFRQCARIYFDYKNSRVGVLIR